jgi:interleukin 17C
VEQPWECLAGRVRKTLAQASKEPHWPCPHRIDTDENRYPQKLAVAECLCQGCINARTGRETVALNSVRLHQSLLVLRRQPCALNGTGAPTPGAYAFHTEFIRVPVGCTCVLPRSTQ